MTQPGWKNSIAITGAGSGFGAALARLYASRGWNVAVTDIDEQRARQTLLEIETHGGDSFSMRLDITKADQWQQLQDSVFLGDKLVGRVPCGSRSRPHPAGYPRPSSPHHS